MARRIKAMKSNDDNVHVESHQKFNDNLKDLLSDLEQ